MNFSGLVLIDKASGMTSHDVVGKCRKILKTKAVGHAGTLDPMATGLLVLLVGEATKFSQWVLSGDKSYQAGIKFGLTTDSWDITGKTEQEFSVDFTQDQLHAEISKLSGPVELPVPMYSAIKKNGKKLYEYARKGEEIEEVRRPMNFKTVKYVDGTQEEIFVDLSCEKGGYIRSWAHCLGKNLGTGAVLSSLRRTLSSPYKIEQAMTLEEFAEKFDPEAEPLANMIPMKSLLPNWPSVVIEGRDEKLLCNGTISDFLMNRLRWVDQAGFDSGRITPESRKKLGVKVLANSDKRLLSLVIPKDEKNYKIARVFKS